MKSTTNTQNAETDPVTDLGEGSGTPSNENRATVDPDRDDTVLSRDEIFTVLSNERRQHALNYLKHHDEGHVDLGELVDYITARENDVTVREIDYKQRKRVYTSLRQTHLPKLNECELIEYDRDRGTIEPNNAAQEVQMYLEYVPEHDIPWCYHYLGLTAVLGLIVLVAGSGIYPFGGISGTVLAAIIVVAFGVSAVVHTVYTTRNELGTVSGIQP